MSFNNDKNYKGGGFEIKYIEYIVANDLDFGPKDQEDYENDYDGDVPQVTYMPYVFLMQEAYAKKQKKEMEEAEKFSAVFIPIDNFIMDYLNGKKNKIPYIEGVADIKAIQNFSQFSDLDTAFKGVAGKKFFDYIKRPSSDDTSRRSVPSTPMGIPKDAKIKSYTNRKVEQSERPPLLVIGDIDDNLPLGQPAGGGHRRSHKPSQKKTSKGKSRSRSRSRSKTRSKSKSKSKTRAKSKTKRR